MAPIAFGIFISFDRQFHPLDFRDNPDNGIPAHGECEPTGIPLFAVWFRGARNKGRSLEEIK